MLDAREAIREALRALPPLQRTVLILTALDGLTVREAAVHLERSESATESLLHRARVAFREAYAGPHGQHVGLGGYAGANGLIDVGGEDRRVPLASGSHGWVDELRW